MRCVTDSETHQVTDSFLNVEDRLLQRSSLQLRGGDFAGGLCQENLETLQHRLGHSRSHISALQGQHSLPLGELQHAGGHRCKTGRRDVVAADCWGMALGRVEAGGDEDDAGVEVPDDGTDDGPHGGQVLGVRQREV